LIERLRSLRERVIAHAEGPLRALRGDGAAGRVSPAQSRRASRLPSPMATATIRSLLRLERVPFPLQ